MRPGDAVVLEFSLTDGNGAAANADSTPTATVYRNGTSDGAVTVTVTNIVTGAYKGAFTIPSGYAAGDDVTVLVSATVDTVTVNFWAYDTQLSAAASGGVITPINTGSATTSQPIIGIVTQGDDPVLIRAVTINDAGTERIAVQSDFMSISFRVFDHQSGEVTDGPVALDVASVIDDTPPEDGLYEGMNFAFQMNDMLNKGNRRRTVEVLFTVTGSENFTRRWILWTENILGA